MAPPYTIPRDVHESETTASLKDVVPTLKILSRLNAIDTKVALHYAQQDVANPRAQL